MSTMLDDAAAVAASHVPVRSDRSSAAYEAAVIKPAPSSMSLSPSRTCSSLRSTTLSTGSTDSSSSSSTFEPVCFGEWVYWQRDCEREPDSWTKVFAVVEEDASVGLYGCEDMSPRTLVCRRSMWSVRVEMSRRRIKLVDAHNAVAMRLWLLSHANHAIWKACLDSAVLAAKAPRPARTLSTSSNRPWRTRVASRAVVDVPSVSALSLSGLREAAQASNTSKRSIVKAACRATLAQMKHRLQATAVSVRGRVDG